MTENEVKKILYTMRLAAGLDDFEKPGGVPVPLTKEELADACKMAIKALEEVQQYQALEKRLSDMFGGSLSLKMCVDELERILTEPDSPHPMNAKILTYQEAADWEAYRAIGTVEELIRGMRYMNIAKRHGTIGQVIDECVAYATIGTPEECRKSVDICKAMAERRISLQNMEDYMKFEDECVKRGFTFNSLLEAREKQEPKEPTDRCMYKECFACGEVEIEFCKYCPSCGQKLDWRNEE